MSAVRILRLENGTLHFVITINKSSFELTHEQLLDLFGAITDALDNFKPEADTEDD